MTAFEIVGFAKTGGPLTKRISLSPEGKVISNGSACVMSHGQARRIGLDDLDAFAAVIANLDGNEAIALGTLDVGLPDQVEVVTKRRLNELNGQAVNVIARTSEHIAYVPNKPALALIDIDTKGMPPAVADKIRDAGGFWAALLQVLPGITEAARVTRSSTSSGLYRTDTGERFKGSGGFHIYLVVQDGGDCERFLKTFHDRCWLHGLGWYMIGAGGQLLERSLIDRTVFAAERLVFESAPNVVSPLAQDKSARAPTVTDGAVLDSNSICSGLSTTELARFDELRARARHAIAPQAYKAREAFTNNRAEQIVKRSRATLPAALRVVRRWCEGVLVPLVVLPFDAEEFIGCTVGDVLADPDRFVGATLADPLEGVGYGVCKAMVMRRSDGSPWIHSFAHGRTIYELRHDAKSIEAAIDGAPEGSIADTFVEHVLAADLEADELQRLSDLACARSGTGKRPMAAKLKAARSEQAIERARAERERRTADRIDTRVRLEVPLPDDEVLPIARAIDDVLHATSLAEPPTRDLELWPVEVRAREPFRLHGMTASDANQSSNSASEARNEHPVKLPPPKMWLLTRHDRFSMAHLIEKHIEFSTETEDSERSVALHPKFVEHYIHYRDSKLPVVGAIVTNPLILPDGTLLAPDGLDRERRVIFKIEPDLHALLPGPDDCTPAAVAHAMHFLLDEWLCDVATDFAGKCVLITAAMTIVERVLLPERPAFFVTAGQRGGGKTTVLTMVFLAACGHTPPACAWSPNEEERRKALFSYLGEGIPAVVWDNIPRGSTISCPSIEKSLTSEAYSDRVLGESRTRTVPAFTVNLFTGNNIGPRGDMASRSLMARLAVDRPDPENRAFRHSDPIAWTEGHRGNILRALYTVMRGNPRLYAWNRGPAETRFKTWWHLIGSAVEHGAELLVEEVKWLVVDAPKKAPPTKVSFRNMFNAFEADEEQSSALSTVLDTLNTRWPNGFKTSEIVGFVAGANDEAINFKAALELAAGKPLPVVTATTINWRLQALVDAPTRVGDDILVLRYASERGHGGTFNVRALG